jgi:hypothetical protein
MPACQASCCCRPNWGNRGLIPVLQRLSPFRAYWVFQLCECSPSHLLRGLIPGDFHPNRCYSAPTGKKRTAIFLGVAEGIRPEPWQTDTCIGAWHYDRTIFEQHRYKTVGQVVRMLVDIVSKK